jgi:hypothetical protein
MRAIVAHRRFISFIQALTASNDAIRFFASPFPASASSLDSFNLEIFCRFMN